MNFQEAKAYKTQLENLLDFADKRLKAFDSYGKTAMGLTPDHVRAMPEWQEAKMAFEIAFQNLRNFNAKYTKAFKKKFKKKGKINTNKA